MNYYASWVTLMGELLGSLVWIIPTLTKLFGEDLENHISSIAKVEPNQLCWIGLILHKPYPSLIYSHIMDDDPIRV